jgi:hypothetical protein
VTCIYWCWPKQTSESDRWLFFLEKSYFRLTTMEPKDPTQPSEVDVEKSPLSSTLGIPTNGQSNLLSHFRRLNAQIEGLSGFEARGLERVPSDQRQAPSAMGLLQMLLLWFSANITINNLAVALTGPLVFGLGFEDCAWCAMIGVFLGSLSTAYMSTWQVTLDSSPLRNMPPIMFDII